MLFFFGHILLHIPQQLPDHTSGSDLALLGGANLEGASWSCAIIAHGGARKKRKYFAQTALCGAGRQGFTVNPHLYSSVRRRPCSEAVKVLPSRHDPNNNLFSFPDDPVLSHHLGTSCSLSSFLIRHLGSRLLRKRRPERESTDLMVGLLSLVPLSVRRRRLKLRWVRLACWRLLAFLTAEMSWLVLFMLRLVSLLPLLCSFSSCSRVALNLWPRCSLSFGLLLLCCLLLVLLFFLFFCFCFSSCSPTSTSFDLCVVIFLAPSPREDELDLDLPLAESPARWASSSWSCRSSTAFDIPPNRIRISTQAPEENPPFLSFFLFCSGARRG